MKNKKKIAFSFFVSVLIYVNGGSMFAQSINDTSLVRKQIELSQKAKSEKDSLQMFISAKKAIDISKKIKDSFYMAESYFNIARCHYSFKYYSKAIENYDKAKKYYKTVDSTSGISKCYYYKAIAYFRLSYLDSSLHYHLIAYELRENGNDKSNFAASANAVGLNYWRRGDLNNATKYYKVSLNTRKQIQDIKGVGMVLNALGAVNWGQGKFNTALKYYFEALKIADSLRNTHRYVLIKNNIGLIYQEWEQYDIALKYHLSAKAYCDTIDYSYGLAYSEINAGICYQELNDNKSALVYLKNALLHYQNDQNPIAIAYANRILGDYYFHVNKYNKALSFYRTSYNEATKLGVGHHKILALKGLADTYLKQKRYALAEEHAVKSLNIAKENNYTDVVKDSYYILAELAEKNKKIKLALKYYKKASELKDSISNQTLRTQILDLQEKYESEKKETQNKLLLKEQKIVDTQLKNRNVVIIISFTGLSLLVVFIVILFLNRKKIKGAYKLLAQKNQKINKQKIELQKTIQELEKSNNFRNKIISIIGHDIKGPIGTLESLLSLIVEGQIKGEELQELILALKDKATSTNILIQDLFEWAKNQQGAIPFEPQNMDILSSVSQTIELLKQLALDKSITVKNNTLNNVYACADKKMLSIILRNLLANAIKFTPKNGKIDIKLIDKEDVVNISIEDSGVGIEGKMIKKILSKDEFYTTYGTDGEKGSGLGLQLCNEFLLKNNSKLKIESTVGLGSVFSFDLLKK